MFSEWLGDLEYAWRSLWRSPGFTAVAVLVLALGIGANSAIFSLLNMMLLRPVNMVDPERVVGVYSQHTERPDTYRSFSYPTYLDLREQNEVFTHLAAHSISLAGLQEGDTTRRVMVNLVSSNAFETYGVPPVLGRGFTPEEEQPGAEPVAVVSHSFWERKGRTGVLGSTLRLNGLDVTVVGVAAPGFSGATALFSPELWLPLGLYESFGGSLGQRASSLLDRQHDALMLFGRLRADLEETEAAPNLEVLAQRFEAAYPKALEHQTFTIAPLPRSSISSRPQDDGIFVGPSVLLTAMAGAVLLISCLNLANMFLARGASRRTELAIRLSLGGGRFRLLRQLLSESLILALLGGAGGLFLAFLGTRLLLPSIESFLPFGLHLLLDTSPDWRVLLMTLGFCLIAALASGLGPAWKLSSGELLGDLKETAGQSLSGTGKHRLLAPRNLMVMVQIALSLMLLSAAGLFLRGAATAAEADPGFPIENSLLVELDTGLNGYSEDQGRNLYGEVIERLRALPGVEAAGLSSIVPFGPVNDFLRVRPAGDFDDETAVRSQTYVVGEGYFESIGLPLLQGRGFTAAESTTETGARVVIVNDVLARQLWPEGSAIGQSLQVVRRDPGPKSEPMEIVGVAQGFLHQLSDQQPKPHLFLPLGQHFETSLHVHLRLVPGREGAEAQLMPAIRRELREIDPRLPVLSMQTFTNFRDKSYLVWIFELAAKIFSGLGLVALFLASVGVYGVKAFLMTRRTREIGLRLALGATHGNILRQMLHESLATTATALVAGLLLAAGAVKVLGSLIYGAQESSLPIIAAAAVLLTASATLAAYLPARRALEIEPTQALRQE